MPREEERVLQYYSSEKEAEFASMGPAERLAWLDEIHYLRSCAAAARVGKPAASGGVKRRLGLLAGKLEVPADFDAPRSDDGLSDFEGHERT